MTDNAARSFSTVPVDDEVATVENASAVYDQLRLELASNPDVEPLILGIPIRPTVEVIYSPDIEWDLFDAWMKRATRNKDKRVNPLLFASQVMLKTCIGIRINGKEVVNDDGEPITFVSVELQRMVNARSPQECLSKLYGKRDGHIIQTSGKIVDAAGYGDVDIDDGGDNPL